MITYHDHFAKETRYVDAQSHVGDNLLDDLSLFCRILHNLHSERGEFTNGLCHYFCADHEAVKYV